MSLALMDNNSITWTEDDIKLIQDLYCKNCNEMEFKHFMHVCKVTGLDPRRNQIYAIKRGTRMTIQTGIDGFRLIAERTGKYAPGKEPSFTYDSQGKLVSATSYVKKMTPDGTWHEVSATAFWNEYVVEYNGKPSQFWAKLPHQMLAKVAESICLRKAFPADYSGLYTTEEMAQADNEEINISPQIEPEAPKQIEQDMTLEEVQAWIMQNYKDNPDQFLLWLEEIQAKNKWNYRKTIEQLSKKPEYTIQTFQGWLMNKVGL